LSEFEFAGKRSRRRHYLKLILGQLDYGKWTETGMLRRKLGLNGLAIGGFLKELKARGIVEKKMEPYHNQHLIFYRLSKSERLNWNLLPRGTDAPMRAWTVVNPEVREAWLREPENKRNML
jgi:hypothetical protein